MDLLSVVVRTQPGRDDMLDQALFSLAGQTYAPIQAIVVVHNRGHQDFGMRLGRWESWFQSFDVLHHDFQGDGRTRSLNVGLGAASGRYVAFLDDDDAIYPQHHSRLIEAIRDTGCAWAYADTVRAEYRRARDGGYYLASRSTPFEREAYSFVSHLQGNFIPIHSFVLDLDRVGHGVRFNEALTRHEDYEFLLHVAHKHDPAYVPEVTCEYRIRADGSNSVLDGTRRGRHWAEKRKAWDEADRILFECKQELVGWWASELVAMGPGSASAIIHAGSMEARRQAQRVVDAYWDSTSWKVTRTIRRFLQILRRQQPEQRPIASSVTEAERIAAAIRSSTSWRIAAPIRVLGRMVNGR